MGETLGAKVEGRKTYREIDDAKHAGKMIAMAKRLRRRTPKGGRRSLRAIADELARAGYKSESGKPYAATAIGRMLERSNDDSKSTSALLTEAALSANLAFVASV